MNLLVFAEVRDGKLKKSSLETLSEAVRLSKKLGSKVGVALVGEGVGPHAETLGRHGAAQILGLPRVNVCTSFEVEGTRAKCKRQIEGGEEQIEVSLPCVISVQKGLNGIHDKRFPSMKGIMAAKSKPVETIAAAAVESSLEVVKLEMPPERPPGKIVGKGVEAVPELVRLLREEAKVL